MPGTNSYGHLREDGLVVAFATKAARDAMGDFLERIQVEMRGILEAEGYDASALAAAMNSLNEEERFLYPDSDEGREQILADYQVFINEIDAGLSPMFDVKPKTGVDCRTSRSCTGAHPVPSEQPGERNHALS